MSGTKRVRQDDEDGVEHPAKRPRVAPGEAPDLVDDAWVLVARVIVFTAADDRALTAIVGAIDGVDRTRTCPMTALDAIQYPMARMLAQCDRRMHALMARRLPDMAAPALLTLDRERTNAGWVAWRAAIGARAPTRMVHYAAVAHFRARPDAADVLAKVPWYAPGRYAKDRLETAYRRVTELDKTAAGPALPMAFLLARDEREVELAFGQGTFALAADYMDAVACAIRNGRVCVMERVHCMYTPDQRFPYWSTTWNMLFASWAGADSEASHDWLYKRSGELPLDGISIHTSTSLRWIRIHPPPDGAPFKLLTYTPDMVQYCLDEQRLAGGETNIGELMPHVIARLPVVCIECLSIQTSLWGAPWSEARAACCSALMNAHTAATDVHTLMDHYLPVTAPIAAIVALYEVGENLHSDVLRAVKDFCITRFHASAAMRAVVERYTPRQ